MHWWKIKSRKLTFIIPHDGWSVYYFIILISLINDNWTQLILLLWLLLLWWWVVRRRRLLLIGVITGWWLLLLNDVTRRRLIILVDDCRCLSRRVGISRIRTGGTGIDDHCPTTASISSRVRVHLVDLRPWNGVEKSGTGYADFRRFGSKGAVDEDGNATQGD